MNLIPNKLTGSYTNKAFKMFLCRKLAVVALLVLFFMLPISSFGSGGNNSDIKETEETKGPKFWVVNFGTARTLAPRKIGFAAGVGGQMVFVGEPRTTSAFFTIPHAGFRYGISERLDAGLRLAPIPLPFSTVGPGFGVNLDVKINLSNPESSVQFALVLGAGGAHVLIQDKTKFAYSPNAAALMSLPLKEGIDFTVMGRHVNLAIPTATEGAKANFVNISGVSFGLKKALNSTISILPEVGAYWYEGQIAGARTSGPGFQYGVMLATSF